MLVGSVDASESPAVNIWDAQRSLKWLPVTLIQSYPLDLDDNLASVSIGVFLIYIELL